MNTEKENTKAEDERGFSWWPAIVALLFGGAAAGMAFFTFSLGQAELSAGGLAGALLFGVLTFFFAMAAIIALFKSLGLQQEGFPLGMPPGSIRAFIALVLIMLFFLMAVFLYIDVSRTTLDRIRTVTSESDLRELQQDPNVIVTEVTERAVTAEDGAEQIVWDVVTRSSRPQSEVASEIARQLITVLGTLIVAISSFYFGAVRAEGVDSQPKTSKGTENEREDS